MKREAQKIVETNLIKALDRNDAQAVREACIVLQAMKRQAIDMGNVDVEQDAKINQALQQDPPAIIERVETPDYFMNIKDLGDGTLEYSFEDKIEQVSGEISNDDIQKVSSAIGNYLASTEDTIESSLKSAVNALNTLITKYKDNTVIKSVLDQKNANDGRPILNEQRLRSYIDQIIEKSADPVKLKRFAEEFGKKHENNAGNLIFSLTMLASVIGAFIFRITFKPE